MIKVNNNLRHTSCPLCKSNLITFSGPIICDNPIYFSTIIVELEHQSELWNCNICQSSFVQNSVSEKDAIDLYTKGSSSERWTILDFEKSKTKETVNFFQSILKPNFKVLDIGCGSGNFLDFAKKKGCITYGVEYSESSREVINNKGHLSFNDVTEIDEKFDIITGFDVIEHMYDVPAFLEICSTKLKEEGLLLLMTGNISCFSAKLARSKWWYAKYPEHIVFPSILFFAKYSKFMISECKNVYHSPGLEVNLLKCFLKNGLNIIRLKGFNGSPSFVPDHSLMSLKF